jgi:hypothetical protein
LRRARLWRSLTRRGERLALKVPAEQQVSMCKLTGSEQGTNQEAVITPASSDASFLNAAGERSMSS